MRYIYIFLTCAELPPFTLTVIFLISKISRLTCPFLLHMRNILQTMFNTCNSSFCQISSFISSNLVCVRHFDLTFHGCRVTSLCISPLQLSEVAIQQGILPGLLVPIFYKIFPISSRSSFDQISFFIWSQLSMSDKRFCHADG